MRHGLVLGILPASACSLAFAWALAFAAAACGGSSSETPPPLQPDPRGFHYAGVAAAEPESGDAGPEPAAVETDDDDKPRAPARSTWGGAAPRR